MTRRVRLTVNGVAGRVEVPDSALLLDVLREEFGCVSVREGCGVGVCGACSVLVDGRSVSSCLLLAVRADGAEVTTAEGLPAGDDVVTAFAEHGAAQCGYCIPGFVLMAHELLTENAEPDHDDIVAHLAGNLCRCGTYREICAAVAAAAERRRSGHRPRAAP